VCKIDSKFRRTRETDFQFFNIINEVIVLAERKYKASAHVLIDSTVAGAADAQFILITDRRKKTCDGLTVWRVDWQRLMQLNNTRAHQEMSYPNVTWHISSYLLLTYHWTINRTRLTFRNIILINAYLLRIMDVGLREAPCVSLWVIIHFPSF